MRPKGCCCCHANADANQGSHCPSTSECLLLRRKLFFFFTPHMYEYQQHRNHKAPEAPHQPEQAPRPISDLVFQGFLAHYLTRIDSDDSGSGFRVIHFTFTQLHTVPPGSCGVHSRSCSGRFSVLLKGKLPVRGGGGGGRRERLRSHNLFRNFVSAH